METDTAPDAQRSDSGRSTARATSIRFEPWVGDSYGHYAGGVRLLVLGESHYHRDNSPGSDFTRVLTQGYLNGTMRHRFWTLVARGVEGQVSKERCRAFWHSVAFYNYIQTIVGGRSRIAPTDTMWTDARQPLLSVLEQLQPLVILVLGKRLWAHLPLGEAQPLELPSGESWPARWIPYGDKLAYATFINHPASLGAASKHARARWKSVVEALCGARAT